MKTIMLVLLFSLPSLHAKVVEIENVQGRGKVSCPETFGCRFFADKGEAQQDAAEEAVRKAEERCINEGGFITEKRVSENKCDFEKGKGYTCVATFNFKCTVETELVCQVDAPSLSSCVQSVMKIRNSGQTEKFTSDFHKQFYLEEELKLTSRLEPICASLITRGKAQEVIDCYDFSVKRAPISVRDKQLFYCYQTSIEDRMPYFMELLKADMEEHGQKSTREWYEESRKGVFQGTKY